MMKRRTFLAMLGGTALVPVGFDGVTFSGTIRGLAYYTGKLSNAAMASLTADFVNDKYSIDGIDCSLYDIIGSEETSFIDYDGDGKCLGLYVGEIVTAQSPSASASDMIK